MKKAFLLRNPIFSRLPSLIDAAGIFVLALLTLYLMFWNLGASSISLASDEVAYVRVAQTTAHEGTIFPLWHGGQPFYEKPPLKFWASTAVLTLFGENNVTFRVLDSFFGVVAVLLTTLLARTVFGWSAGCIVAGLLVLSAPEWIISHHSFRRAVLDGFLTVLVLGAGVAGWKALDASSSSRPVRPYLTWFGILCSLAVLVKSVAGLVPVFCMVPLILSARCTRSTWMGYLIAMLLPFLVLSTYVAVLSLAGGSRAFETFVGTELFQRVMTGFEGHNTADRFFYGRYLFVRGGAVAPILLVAGLLGCLFGARHDARYRFVLAWSVIPVLLYSLSTARVPWYLNPFIPFYALTAVFGAVYLYERIGIRAIRALTLAAIVAVTAVPYYRSVLRHVRFVSEDNERIELDVLVDKIREESGPVTIVSNCLSGRTSPRMGRFNVEGIYREILKHRLSTVDSPARVTGEEGVVILPEEMLSHIPGGWSLIGTIAPFNGRKDTIATVLY